MLNIFKPKENTRVPEPKYNRGDLVIWNQSRNFGNEEDKLFHIHHVRYGTCTNITEKQYWYSGFLFEIGEYKSKGLPKVPVFFTTITNASEDNLKGLEYLVLPPDYKNI